ncbi:hypothetical protein [Tunicatimonas pelagia]|uniref:hypothetical protein n=1 Tax=Tunicatimonas pelagia TaxID=931531 RepID=UPI002665BF29|nr:hypothetical protein [Tunicatimonas pelagia]WKN43090.1 hypothetical protein P0M28_29045 [Tunicatimonas pelagia]
MNTKQKQMNTSTNGKESATTAEHKKNIDSYDIANSYETMHLAQDLARFIKENKLFHHIQGKAYVNVEGWQYAGSRLGILPVIDDLVNISLDNSETKYQAKVRLLNLKTQQTVGSGFAICSNRENGKRNYQEFAIASMAQTRAIGKAYRNILAWIIRAAGYEPTPAEEMDYMAADRSTEPSGERGNRRKSRISSSSEQTATKNSKKTDNKNLQISENKADNGEKSEEVVKKMATVKQKTELLLLLNNKAITNNEKNKMIEGINSLDSVRASKAIQKIKKVIEDRESNRQSQESIETHAA